MYERILLATDLADDSEQIAQKAASLANAFNSELSIIHVLHPIPSYGYLSVSEMEDTVFNNAQKQLRAISDRISVRPENQHVVFGSVKSQVIKLAEKLDVDLIIVGSHDKHGLSKLMGSNANAIIHASHKDVYVIRTYS